MAKRNTETKSGKRVREVVDELSAPEVLALGKAVKDGVKDAVRNEVEPGAYPIDMVVRIEGILAVAEDTEARVTSSFLSLETLALLCQRLGATREQTLTLLREIARTQLEKGGNVGIGIAEYVRDLEAFKAEFARMCESLPKTKKKGAVTAKLIVTKVE